MLYWFLQWTKSNMWSGAKLTSEISYPRDSCLAQLVRHWPEDLEVLVSIPTGDNFWWIFFALPCVKICQIIWRQRLSWKTQRKIHFSSSFSVCVRHVFFMRKRIYCDTSSLFAPLSWFVTLYFRINMHRKVPARNITSYKRNHQWDLQQNPPT